MGRQDVLALLKDFSWSGSDKAHDSRLRGVRRLLEWLSAFPGTTWQERWMASGSDVMGTRWADLVAAQLQAAELSGLYLRRPKKAASLRTVHNELRSGVLHMAGADVIRPALGWLLARQSPAIHHWLLVRDPAGHDALRTVAGESWESAVCRTAQGQIASLLLAKGGSVDEITVGDCLELRRTKEERAQSRLPAMSLFYALLKDLGNFPPEAPATLRSVTVYTGQASVEMFVDRYQLKCRRVPDLLVEYLSERAPALDFNTLEELSRTLARRFWAVLGGSGSASSGDRFAPSRTGCGRRVEDAVADEDRRTASGRRNARPGHSASPEADPDSGDGQGVLPGPRPVGSA
ncbi:hypothetical protein [Streptomyces sp. NPDC013457]|uniref:hypothetical protein n=1 Tax=Streptomyces sp. NPDC013457 TaxID=3364866 RepID=UPI0036F7D490